MLDGQVSENIDSLYSGSVHLRNAAQLLNMPNVDGSLIGGTSLIAKDLIRICQIANAATELKTTV